MKRKLSTPAILLLALSMGMWLGASWHSASQNNVSGKCCVTCLDGAQLLASIQNHNKAQRITATKLPAGPSACAFCLAGALVQDAPPYMVSELSVAMRAMEVRVPHLLSIIDVHVLPLPPTRGPPSA